MVEISHKRKAMMDLGAVEATTVEMLARHLRLVGAEDLVSLVRDVFDIMNLLQG